jgi:mRNA-degrading endonuclease toxin of MazEF toxin-antitoxin module
MGPSRIQLVGSLPKGKLMRRLGRVSSETLGEVETTMKLWLGLPES